MSAALVFPRNGRTCVGQECATELPRVRREPPAWPFLVLDEDRRETLERDAPVADRGDASRAQLSEPAITFNLRLRHVCRVQRLDYLTPTDLGDQVEPCAPWNTFGATRTRLAVRDLSCIGSQSSLMPWRGALQRRPARFTT